MAVGPFLTPVPMLSKQQNHYQNGGMVAMRQNTTTRLDIRVLGTLPFFLALIFYIPAHCHYCRHIQLALLGSQLRHHYS